MDEVRYDSVPIDLGEIALKTAEMYMDKYEADRITDPEAHHYLTIAGINLNTAKTLKADVTEAEKRLQELRAGLKKQPF
jgi:hypothetical protein